MHMHYITAQHPSTSQTSIDITARVGRHRSSDGLSEGPGAFPCAALGGCGCLWDGCMPSKMPVLLVMMTHELACTGMHICSSHCFIQIGSPIRKTIHEVAHLADRHIWFGKKSSTPQISIMIWISYNAMIGLGKLSQNRRNSNLWHVVTVLDVNPPHL